MLHILQIHVRTHGDIVKLCLNLRLEKIICRDFPQDKSPLAVRGIGGLHDLHKLCIVQGVRVGAPGHIAVAGGNVDFRQLAVERVLRDLCGRVKRVCAVVQGQVFELCPISQRNRPCPLFFFHVMSFPNRSLKSLLMLRICCLLINL